MIPGYWKHLAEVEFPIASVGAEFGKRENKYPVPHGLLELPASRRLPLSSAVAQRAWVTGTTEPKRSGHRKSRRSEFPRCRSRLPPPVPSPSG